MGRHLYVRRHSNPHRPRANKPTWVEGVNPGKEQIKSVAAGLVADQFLQRRLEFGKALIADLRPPVGFQALHGGEDNLQHLPATLGVMDGGKAAGGVRAALDIAQLFHLPQQVVQRLLGHAQPLGDVAGALAVERRILEQADVAEVQVVVAGRRQGLGAWWDAAKAEVRVQPSPPEKAPVAQAPASQAAEIAPEPKVSASPQADDALPASVSISSQPEADFYAAMLRDAEAEMRAGQTEAAKRAARAKTPPP